MGMFDWMRGPMEDFVQGIPNDIVYIGNSLTGKPNTAIPTGPTAPPARPENLTGAGALDNVTAPPARPEELINPTADAESTADEEAKDEEPECTTGKCCQLVTEAMLKQVFSKASDDRLQVVADGLNYNINSGKIDTEFRLTHFIGQTRTEVGPYCKLSESLNYSPEGLRYNKNGKIVFSYFVKHKEEAYKYGRTSEHPADQEAIANRAYANRIGNGNVESGDGWKYRGRGLKQLTGKDNYADFTKKHKQVWGEDIDFVANPDLVSQPKYAVRSALYFWVFHKLYTKADGGVSEKVANTITEVINIHTDSYGARWNNVDSIYSKRLFEPICFNTSKLLSNTKAEEPK